MRRRALAAPFVVTVASAACDHVYTNPPPTHRHDVAPPDAGDGAGEAADAERPSAIPVATASASAAPVAREPFGMLNEKVGGQTVYRNGDICVIGVYGANEPPLPNRQPTMKDIPCPASMKGPGWAACGGEVHRRADAKAGANDGCVCIIRGNPPPPNQSMKCP